MKKYIATSVLTGITLIAILIITRPLFASHKIAKVTAVAQIKTSPTATITPTPSPTPTSAPIPSGFCLNVPVLMYHHIEPYNLAVSEHHGSLTVDSAMFEKQLQYINAHGYHTITAETLITALANKSPLPGKSIVLTSDDGYSDIYTYAYPLIQKYNVILNLMIPTGLLENPGYMTWGQLKEMVSSGKAEAYDHSWSHYSMPNGNDAKDQMEIQTAQKQLEEHLGKPVNIFTYPYGSSTPRVVSLLQKDGFAGAFSTIPGTLQCSGYIFDLRRTRIGNAPLSSYGL